MCFLQQLLALLVKLSHVPDMSYGPWLNEEIDIHHSISWSNFGSSRRRCWRRQVCGVVVARAGTEFLRLLHWARRRRHDLCAIIVGSNRWSLPFVRSCRRSLSGLVFI